MLIKILNQLGVCASADTLSRYIQLKNSNRVAAINEYLSTESFTIVSADNIDFLHNYARVSKGSNSSTTSIQVVQPQPSLSEQLHIPSCDNPNHTAMGTLGTKRATEGSASTCLPPTKKRRMPRTGTEQPCSHITDQHENIRISSGNISGHNKKCELKWVVPYPGDWHALMNYQKALMKPYFDAGLKSMAEACGYPTASIKQCTQFKRTHLFIIEAWEALYRTMLIKFIESGCYKVNTTLLDDVVQSLLGIAAETRNEFFSQSVKQLLIYPIVYHNLAKSLMNLSTKCLV